MENFDKKYNDYIARLKKKLSWLLKREHSDFLKNFKEYYQKIINSFESLLGIVWFIVLIGIRLLVSNVVLTVIIFVVWIGIGVWICISFHIYKEDIAECFFYRFERKRIIEDLIKSDQQQEINEVLNQMFQEYSLNIADIDTYKSKIDDINYFYCRCLSNIKYENLV